MIAEFEAGLARARTGEGLAVAKAKGQLRGKQPKLNPRLRGNEAVEVSVAARAPPHQLDLGD